ncbi:MAG: hypothetical protein ACKOB3_00680 [Holophagaceae bacterium]
MAGFERAFFLGRGLGGFQGCDGLRAVDFVIIETGDDPARLGVSYYKHQDQSLGKIQRVSPSKYDGNLSPTVLSVIADICIIFCPSLFKNCSSFPELEELLENFNQKTLWLDSRMSEGIDHELLRNLLTKIKTEGQSILASFYFCEFSSTGKLTQLV